MACDSFRRRSCARYTRKRGSRLPHSLAVSRLFGVLCRHVSRNTFTKVGNREHGFERIDLLVTKEDFCFQAWNDRYSKGVWAALGLWENQVDTVRDLSSMGDLDMIPAMDYVFSADWLPYVTGRTLADAYAKAGGTTCALPPRPNSVVTASGPHS